MTGAQGTPSQAAAPLLMPRRRALAAAPVFAAAFCALQRAVFDETPGLWESAAVPAAMPAFAGSLVWRARGGGGRTGRYALALANGLTALLELLEQPAWLVLPLHRRAAWAGDRDRRVPYPPLARAREALCDALRGTAPPAAGTARQLSGALRVDAASARVIVPLWFWSSRCGTLPGGAYAAAGVQPLLASLCQHGNLHLEVYDARLLRRLRAAASACGFVAVRGTCTEAFGRSARSATAAIAGRTLKV